MSVPQTVQNTINTGLDWIGEIPNHWVIGPFKTLVAIQNGADYKDVEDDQGFPVMVSGGPFAYSKNAMYDGETVLLGRKGTIDKPLYYKGPFWAVDTMYWSKISPNANGRFAYYVATTIPFAMYATNTALPSMTKSTLGAHLVAYPSKDEQDYIANWLDLQTARIDTLIAKKTRFIELLKEKRQAVITKAVTKGLDDSVGMKNSGVEWIGSVPFHWKVVPLKHLLEGALQYGATESGEVFIEEWPRYIRITDIDLHGRLRSEGAKSLDPSIAEPYLIKKWDILFARSGATVGKSFIYEGEDYKACFAGYMIRASANPSLIFSEYLYFYLQSHTYWEYIVGSQSQATIQNVSAEKYGALLVPLPPIEEQSILLTFLKKSTSRLDELTSKTERSIDLLKEKRSALITAAVTGKINVREAA